MRMVITKVKLKSGSAESCAELFNKTNPDLVRNEPDWLGARMVIDRETDTMTVLALWRNTSAYEAMANRPAFQNTMKQFSEYFTAPPEITLTDVLVEMTPDSVLGCDAKRTF